jgi:hypothetical protein
MEAKTWYLGDLENGRQIHTPYSLGGLAPHHEGVIRLEIWPRITSGHGDERIE